MKIITNSAQETKTWAQNYAQKLSNGQVLALNGDLGTGKTTFAQGLALGLGITDIVNSPTYVIMKIYPSPHKHIKQLVHIDAYRLQSGTDLETIGVMEYFSQTNTIILIEWAQKIKSILPKSTVFIDFKTINSKQRLINIK